MQRHQPCIDGSSHAPATVLQLHLVRPRYGSLCCELLVGRIREESGRRMEPGAFDSPTTARPVKKTPSASARPPWLSPFWDTRGAARGVCTGRQAGVGTRRRGGAGRRHISINKVKSSGWEGRWEARPSVGGNATLAGRMYTDFTG